MPPDEPTAKPVEDAWALVSRVDLASGEVSSTRRTSIGGLRARANLTRTGVFKYRQSNGTTRNEYRPPEEVFDRDSLDSLGHVPLTIGHPSRVTPETWRQLSNGHVGEKPHRAGKFVAADIHIEDASAANDTEEGKLRELSCGYSCHLEPTPGVTPDGEAYDGIQRKIRYNHVALLPDGFGRAGRDVRLHLDAADAVSGEGDGEPYVLVVNDQTHEEVAMAMTPQEQAALDKALADAKAAGDRADAAAEETRKANEKATAALTSEATVKGEKAVLEEKLRKQNLDSTKDADAAAREKEIAEAISLRADCATIFAGDATFKPEGKSNDALRREAIAKMNPELTLDAILAPLGDNAVAKAAVVLSTYRVAKVHFDKVDAASKKLAGVLDPNARKDAGGDEMMSTEDARTTAIKRKRDAWKKGTKFDKGAKDAKGSK